MGITHSTGVNCCHQQRSGALVKDFHQVTETGRALWAALYPLEKCPGMHQGQRTTAPKGLTEEREMKKATWTKIFKTWYRNNKFPHSLLLSGWNPSTAQEAKIAPCPPCGPHFTFFAESVLGLIRVPKHTLVLLCASTGPSLLDSPGSPVPCICRDTAANFPSSTKGFWVFLEKKSVTSCSVLSQWTAFKSAYTSCQLSTFYMAENNPSSWEQDHILFKF